jgi:general secretion pathway protein G
MCFERRRGLVRARAGFSLIEIMVVVVILGLLASAVVLTVDSYMDKARANRARSDIATIVSAVELYKMDHSGTPPRTDQGLAVLTLKNRNDPWGRPYEYRSPALSEPYEVFTLGADGMEGGDGPNADISSADVEAPAKGNM